MKRWLSQAVLVVCLGLGVISLVGCGAEEPAPAPVGDPAAEIDMGEDPAAYEAGEEAIE